MCTLGLFGFCLANGPEYGTRYHYLFTNASLDEPIYRDEHRATHYDECKRVQSKMPDSSSLTLRVSTETKAKLERLAGHTRRTRNFLAGQALDAYLDRELEIIEAIERGRAEIRSGQGLSTEEVFRDVEAAIAEVEAAQAKR